MTKTLLVHLDHSTKSKGMQFPSPLGLLKLYSYEKRIGNDVRITSCKRTPKNFVPDEICFSPIFLFNLEKDIGYIRSFQSKFKKAKIKIGGVTATLKPELFEQHVPGAEVITGLQSEFEHETPCYEALGMDFSFGFTSRGCTRKCPWCVVPKIEGKLYKNEHWKNYLAPGHTHFISMDNNILACGYDWVEGVLAELTKRGMTIDFNQGLDCRMFAKDERFVELFKRHRQQIPVVRFSWDSKGVEKAATKTLDLITKHGMKSEGRWYMLYGFNDTPEEIWHRLNVITKNHNHKVKPMIYRNLETGGTAKGWHLYAKKLFTLRAGPVDFINCFDFQIGMFGSSPEEFSAMVRFVGRNFVKVKKFLGKDMADRNDFEKIKKLALSGKW